MAGGARLLPAGVQNYNEPGAMVWQLRALAVLTDDQAWLSAPAWYLITVYDSSSRDPVSSSQLCGH